MAKFISIKLLQSKPVWSPGDTILGEVHFSCMEQADIQSVSISFEGKSKAKFRQSNGNSTTTYKSKMRLFYSNKVVLQGPFTFLPGSMSWPFEFPIPTNCRWTTGDGFDPDPLFDTTREQPLPPSFQSADGRKECQIVYTLTAVMQSSRTFSTNREAVVPITIMPSRLYEPSQFEIGRIPRKFGVQTLHLDPDISNRSLTFKEKMRTAFKSETLPRTNFTISMELPGAILASGPINPIICLEHNLAVSTATEIPVVSLVAFSLALKYDIAIRTAGLMHNRLRDWTHSRQLCTWIGSIPLSEREEILKTIRPGFVLPPSITPAFSTHNIVLRYRWKVKYSVQCATKRMDGEASLPCVVLGPLGSDVIATQPGPSAVAAAIPMEEEQLPAYSKEGEAILVG